MLLREAISGRIAGMRIVEDFKRTPGTLGRVAGIFGQSDVLNKNGRVYERALWEHVLGEDRYRKAVEDKTLLSEPDHPETRTQSAIKEASHTVVEVTLDEQGNLRGVVEVFDNALGRMVWPMLQAGVKLGFSTRGDGDLIEDARSGHTRVDPKTYEWHGVDFVLNPSFVAAMPESVTEDVKTQVRTALMEAVGEKKIQEGVKEDVEALLEGTAAAPVVVDFSGTGDTVSLPPNTQALESALSQLRDAKERISELEGELTEVTNTATDVEEGVVQWKTEAGKLREQLKQERGKFREAHQRLKKLSGRVRALSSSLKEAEDTAETDGLKRVLKENQDSHMQLVEKHRKTLEASKRLEEKSREIIEGLRDRITEAEKRTQEAESALKEVEGAEPEKVRNATLDQYKRLKSEGVEMQGEIKRLLERAQTEAEVNALVEALQSSQASRYDYLPLGLDSRKRREDIMEAVDEQTEKDERESEADQDREETARVVRSQLRR